MADLRYIQVPLDPEQMDEFRERFYHVSDILNEYKIPTDSVTAAVFILLLQLMSNDGRISFEVNVKAQEGDKELLH